MVHKAWILQKMIVGESDIIVTLFLENGKKLQAIAKSALKRDSKLRAHLEPHRIVEVLLTGNMVKPTLAECVAVVSPLTMEHRLFAEQYSLILESFGETMDHEETVRLLEFTLEKMKKTGDVTKLHAQTIHTLFSYAGIEMVLGACVECGKRESGEWYYGEKNGGITCENCRYSEDRALPANMPPEEVIRILWKHGQFFAIKPLKNKREIA